MGSKLRRYATPPRQLRVTIPARNAGTYCERSHRRLPSDNVITAPPRVLARSISELVGGDDTDEVAARLVGRLPLRTVADERLCADNVDEVGRLGW